MKKPIVALILSTCFFGLAQQAIAITEMTPPYTLPHAAYGNTYDRYFTYYDAAGSIQYAYVKQGYDYHDFNVYYYWAGQTIVAQHIGGYAQYIDGYPAHNTLLIQCDSSNTNCFEWTTAGSVMGIPSSCSTPPILSTFDLYWGDTSMSQYADPLFCDIGVLSANQQFVTANIVVTPPATPLSFPLSGYTAYTAPVSSVMDHLGTVPYSDSDHQVVAFNGEASNEGSPYPSSTCYGKSDNSSFGSGFNYVGTSGTGGSYYLCYNGHPGYDYPATSGTDIHAPANGTLCVATSVTQQQQPADVWRDAGHCPLSTVGGTTWSSYHTFYIIHEGLYVNGSTNDYMTVFLHSNDLESTVRANVEQYGYAQVTMSQHIAEVGDVGASGAYHVHLEVYKKNGENWDRVDPYGDGTNNILWEQN